MITNADITIYNKHYSEDTRLDEWKRTQIPGVEWYGGQTVNISDKDLNSANTYIVRIPTASAPQGKQYVLPEDFKAADSSALAGLWTLQNGDIVVRGLIDKDISKAADITTKYSQCFTVTGWKDNRRGSPAVRHWRIDGA